MPRVCAVTGKRTRVGYQITRRGLAKKKGGVGRKVTGRNKRTFKPNLQDVRVLTPEGGVLRMKLCTGVIKKGVITLTKGGRTVSYPLVRATRGRQRAWNLQQAALNPVKKG
jgi:large subunit ribosomal protein L28